MAIRGRVGDALAAVRPLDGVALTLHQLDELLPVDGVLHGFVDLDGQLDLPALAPQGGVVLRLTDSRSLLLPGFTDGQAALQAQLVREVTELGQVVLPEVELPPGLEADGVHDQVRVDVVTVRVRGHDDLVVWPLRLRQLQRDLVRRLRRDRLVRVEGLDEVEVHLAVALAVLQLRADEFRVAALGLAVQAGDQLASLICRLLRLHGVLQDGAHAAAGLLPTGAVDGIDRRHGSHRPLQDLFHRLLNLTVEVSGLAKVGGCDAAHVGQRRQLVEVRPLGFQRTGK